MAVTLFVKVTAVVTTIKLLLYKLGNGVYIRIS